MIFKKLNSVVSYLEKPVLGSINGKNPVMALAIDKESRPLKGIVRIITKRKGDVDEFGFVDMSKLILVESIDGTSWKKIKDLKIKKIKKIIKKLTTKEIRFIGLEDPDIITDEKGIKHVYFTIAFKRKTRPGCEVFLGHAKGPNLDNLKATKPILKSKKGFHKFKETCISPVKTGKFRYILNESLIHKEPEGVSVISLTKAKNIGKPWKFIKFIFDPRDTKFSWIGGHASPCCFLPIKHKNLLVGIVNGREKSDIKGEKIHYRKFRPGLFLFNPKTGEIPWVSPQPLLEDPKATTITFASDFIQTGKDEGLLYCHVNDSFIRAYKINFKELKKLLPKKV